MSLWRPLRVPAVPEHAPRSLPICILSKYIPFAWFHCTPRAPRAPMRAPDNPGSAQAMQAYAAVVPLHPLQDRNSMWHVPVPLYMPVYEEKSTCQNGAQQPDNCNMVTWSVLLGNNAHVVKRALETSAGPRSPEHAPRSLHIRIMYYRNAFLSYGFTALLFGTRASLA